MPLHSAAQFGNQPLRLFGEQLGQRERRDALQDGGPENRQHQRFEQRVLAGADDIIDQVLGRTRQNHAGPEIDQHQEEAQAELGAARVYQLLEQGPDAAKMFGGFSLGFGWSHFFLEYNDARDGFGMVVSESRRWL